MIEWFSDATALPLVGMAQNKMANSQQQLIGWLAANKDEVVHLLHIHGAVLFRGFGVAAAEEFESIAGIFCNEFADYLGGNSPRSKVTSNVFTSTEYPKEERISMHNEASYLPRMPRRILFFCQKPALKGGQTPLADCRRVLKRIDPQVLERFERFGVRYVNNLHGGRGLGKSWMEAFCTKDRHEVESRLQSGNQDFDWKPNGGLRTSTSAPATTLHPQTQEKTWINQAEQWHSSSLDSALLEDMLSILNEEDLPHNAFFGDGSAVPARYLQNIREAMAAEERVFEWNAGDVLLCDNLLVMHGRQAYSGDRRVLAAMG